MVAPSSLLANFHVSNSFVLWKNTAASSLKCVWCCLLAYIFTNTLYEPSITELDAVLLVSVCNSLGSRANWKSCCPRAVALAMCWSAVCSAPVCCNGMVFTLGLQGFVRSCIETGLSVSIYIVYWRCNSYLKWTWVMGKVYSIYLSYKFFSCWCCLR